MTSTQICLVDNVRAHYPTWECSENNDYYQVVHQKQKPLSYMEVQMTLWLAVPVRSGHNAMNDYTMWQTF